MIRINLLPPELRKKKRFVLIDKTLLYVIFGIILLVFFLNFITTQQKSRIAELEKEIEAVKAELLHYQHITELVAKIEKAKATIEKRVETFTRLDRERIYWIDHFSALGKQMPELVWLNNYDHNEAIVTLKGTSYSMQNIATLMVQFIKGGVFDELSLSYVKETSIQGYGTAYVFELRSKPPTTVKKKKEEGGITKKIRGEIGTKEEAKKAAEAYR